MIGRLSKLRSIMQYRQFSKASAGVGISLFAVVGTILLFSSKAATPFASIEPETGIKTANATLVTDQTASGGSAVKFGTELAQSANLFVAVGGTGPNCTQTAPCGDINTAYQKANPGDIIEVAGGTYADQTIVYRLAANTWNTNVVVRPANSTVVTFNGLRINSTHVTFQRIKAFGAYFDYNGHNSRFENMNVAGSTFIVSSNNIAIVNSRLGPSPGNDSIKIAPGNRGDNIPTNILLEGNELGPALLTDPLQHLDTLQTHGVKDLTIRRNIFHEAASQTINLGEESGANTNILIENNVIEQCNPGRPECGAYYATGGGGTNVRFEHNTIKGGPYPESFSYYIGNIIDNGGGYSVCTDKFQYNLFNTGSNSSCGGTNRVLRNATLNYAADGWHLIAGHPAINLGVVGGSTTDYDGQTRDAQPDAGADEF